MRIPVVFMALALTFLFAGQSFGQFITINERTANMRSSPSLTGSYVVLQVPRHYPLQVEEENGSFFRVRDFQGRNGWVAKSVVTSEPGIVVTANTVNVRSGPGKNHKVMFKARKGVAFRVQQNGSDWLYVEHESGRRGWIYKSLVWGL